MPRSNEPPTNREMEAMSTPEDGMSLGEVNAALRAENASLKSVVYAARKVSRSCNVPARGMLDNYGTRALRDALIRHDARHDASKEQGFVDKEIQRKAVAFAKVVEAARTLRDTPHMERMIRVQDCANWTALDEALDDLDASKEGEK